MLSSLLTDTLRFDPFYGSQGQLFMHLPMALQALARMGANDERLAAFAKANSAKLELKQPCEAVLQSEWQVHLGQARYYAGYESLFVSWIARDGLHAVLLQTLPVLIPGVASAAFHALIRLSYALQAQHVPEIAAALASWACAFELLDAFDEPAAQHDASRSLADVMQAARQEPSLAMPQVKLGFIAQRMFTASSLEGLGALVSAARNAKPSLRDVAACSLAVYRDSINFTALHMVTATHAARVLCEQVPSIKPLLMPHLLPAWLAAWVSIDRPAVDLRLTYEANEAAQPWPALLACAINADDEHDIKIVYSAWCEQLHYGFAGYALACTQVMQEHAC